MEQGSPLAATDNLDKSTAYVGVRQTDRSSKLCSEICTQ